MTIRRSLVVALLALVLGPLDSAAQTLTGSITGTIRDEQGGVLPGVTVTLTGRAGSSSTVSDPEGTYRFPAVDPGTYTVSAELQGFRGAERQNIVVNVGRQLAIDLALGVGGVAEQVTVTADSLVVDVTSSATETTISQDLLFNAPITRTAINVLNYAPGINNSSAFGGEASTANALLVDGVDTRDPSGGSAWTFYNYNMVEEVQFQGLGAPAEYGGFTGAVVNTITKSGGNRFSGLFDFLGTNSDLGSNNITPEIVAQNESLRDPATTTKYLDYTAQLGGPLAKDRLFFFASAQRFLLETDPTGPVTRRHEVSPRFNFKLTYQPSANDSFTGHFQADDYNIIGRPGVSALLATDELTNREDAPEYFWVGQWRHLFGSTTFSEIKYTGWWGYFDLNPEVNAPGHLDGETGLFSVSQGWFYAADRGRHQVNASVSHYAEGFGRHDLKFGAEFERSRTRDRYGYVDDVFFYDYGGAPYLAYNYGYDVSARNRRESLYAQDSWKIGDRLTINAGARFDWIRGVGLEGDAVYDTKSLAPRLGFAWDLAGDYRSVLKGFYGQYYDAAMTTVFNRAVPGIEDFVLFEVGAGGELIEIDRTPARVYDVDSGVDHPRVDEFNLGFERAVTNDIRFSATGVWRETTNFINSVLPDARWTPVTLPNELTNGTITGYRWTNPDASEDNFLIRNVDGFRYLDPSGNALGIADPRRKYRALMLVLNKRYTNRWQAQASYVLSKATGTVDNTFSAQVSSRQFESASTALVNVEGNLTNDRRHEFKLLGSYLVPAIDVSVNAYYRILSGRNYTPFQQYSNRQLNFPISSLGRRILLEPRGSRRLETENIVDLRLEKIFRFGNDSVSIYSDIINAFNATVITSALTRVPSTSIAGLDDPVDFGAPGAVIAPRQITIGARWAF